MNSYHGSTVTYWENIDSKIAKFNALFVLSFLILHSNFFSAEEFFVNNSQHLALVVEISATIVHRWHFAFVSHVRWNFSLILKIYLQNVGGNFQRQFCVSLLILVTLCFFQQNVGGTFQWYFTFPKCRWKFPSTFSFQSI